MGAGLKKWTPHTLSDFCVSMAISITGSVEVLVARMASSLHTSLSSRNSSRLVARSSTIDSITRSQSARSCRRGGGGDPGQGGVAVLGASSLPRSTCLASDLSREATMASADACWRDRRTTVWPLLAATSAMPEPMIPEPTMPTLLIVMARRLPTGSFRQQDATLMSRQVRTRWSGTGLGGRSSRTSTGHDVPDVDLRGRESRTSSGRRTKPLDRVGRVRRARGSTGNDRYHSPSRGWRDPLGLCRGRSRSFDVPAR